MHITYDDILSRIAEPPLWWANGVPRYNPFHPQDLDVYAREALLVHIRCQSCGTDFHIGMWDAGHLAARSFKEQLASHTRIHVGDPPNIGCCSVGPVQSADEIAILEFWERKDLKWVRIPELERGLWTSEDEQEENHREAWRRIHIYDARAAGSRPEWTPGGWSRFDPPGIPADLPATRSWYPPEERTRFDSRPLATRRRLAMLAVKGKITCEEFRALEQADRDAQDEFARRPEGEMPDWAVPLIDEIAALDEAVLANAIPGYADMASDEREIFYCHGLRRRLYPLARSGRMTPEEYSAVRGMLMRERFSH